VIDYYGIEVALVHAKVEAHLCHPSCSLGAYRDPWAKKQRKT